MKNVFYCPHINAIGGIETFLYEIALKYGQTHDITIMYKSGDPAQIERYMNLVRCIRWDGQMTFKCDKLFAGYTTDIAHYCEYKELYVTLHCDFYAQRLKFPPDVPKDAHYLCVSDAIKDNCEEWLGLELETAYNPIVIPKEKKRALHLITASRLTREKGRMRMEQLAKALRDKDIPFIWEVFSDDLQPFGDPCITVMKPCLDILPYIAAADYLVQLSDTEAYSYSILEALCVGTPVIITPLPLISDMDIRDGVNGFILPFGMDNIPAEKIARGLKGFRYTPQPDPYEKLLEPGKPDYEEDIRRSVEIKHLINYFDLELQQMCITGQTHYTNLPRARMLEAKGFVIIIGDPV